MYYGYGYGYGMDPWYILVIIAFLFSMVAQASAVRSNSWSGSLRLLWQLPDA